VSFVGLAVSCLLVRVGGVICWSRCLMFTGPSGRWGEFNVLVLQRLGCAVKFQKKNELSRRDDIFQPSFFFACLAKKSI